MLTVLKNRIPFFKSKTLDEYNKSIMMPSFNIIESSYNANLLGLDINIYNNIINKPKNINKLEYNYRVMKMINYIEKNIFDDEFVQKAIKKMIFIVNYGKFSCYNNVFAGTIDVDSEPYKVAVEITDQKITFACEYQDNKLRGSFSSSKHGIKIKYNEKYKRVISYQDKSLFDLNNTTKLEIYDQKYNQIFGYHKSQKYHYYEDNKTKEKIISNIDPDQNYTLNEYKWRCPNNTIIKKREIKYNYPKGISQEIKNTNEFLIGRNISPNNNKLPNKGNYYELNQDLFLDYCSNRCDIMTLWDQVNN